MSRYAFCEIVRNAEALLEFEELQDDRSTRRSDIKGYELSDWLNDAEVGWDEPLRTYFLQAFEINDGADLVWWFGSSDAEIPTFQALCKIINAVFKNSVDFEFINVIVKSNDPAYL